MIIKLEKFGTTLLSRPTGREAFLVLEKTMKDLRANEIIEVDFEGIFTFSPGWGDEVLTPLLKEYGDRLILKNTNNPSVGATREMLEEITGKTFRRA